MAVKVIRKFRLLFDVIWGPPNDGDVATYDQAQDKVIFAPPAAGGVTDHGALTGLSDDDHSQYVHTAPGASARNVIQPTAGAVIAAIVKAHAAQSVDLTQWQNSAGDALVSVGPTGLVTVTPSVDTHPGLLINHPGAAFDEWDILDLKNGAANRVFSVNSGGVIYNRLYSGTSLFTDAAGATIFKMGSARTLAWFTASLVAQQAASDIPGLWTALKNYGLLTSGSAAPDMATQAELDAAIATAIILAPTTNTRNVIQPSSGVDALRLKRADGTIWGYFGEGISGVQFTLDGTTTDFTLSIPGQGNAIQVLKGASAGLSTIRLGASAKIGVFNAAAVAQQAASDISDLWTALKNYGWLTSGSTAPSLALAAQQIIAGSGLSGGGTLAADRTLDVNVDGSTLEINADALRVKDGGVTIAKLSFDPATQAELDAEAAARASADSVLTTAVAAASAIAAVPADDSVDGITIDLTAGEALAFGDPVYVKSDGKVWKADANAAGKYPAIGIAAAAISADATGTILVHGIARYDSAWAWTVGGLVYLSTGAGLTQTQPSATDDVIQVIGVATHADRLYVKPELTYITHI